MSSETTPTNDPNDRRTSSRGPRGRSAAAGILGVLAIVGVLASLVAVWARVTLFDSDRVAATVGDALAEPAVSDAVAQHLAGQLFAAVDVDAAVAETLPQALERFQPAVTGGIRGLVERSLTAALQNAEVQQRLSSAVRRAHGAAMRLLEGDGLFDAATVDNGEVSLNLLPLLDRGLARLQELGLLTEIDLPPLAADGDPAEQIVELETALGRDLPDDFGQLVVYRGDTLARAEASLESAQNAMALAKRAMWVLVVVTLLLLVATVVLARARWRAVLLLSLGSIAVAVLARAATERVVDEAPDVVVPPGAKAAVRSIVGDLGASLLRTLGLVLLIAAVAATVATLKRRWQRGDVIIVASVLVGAIVIGLVGLTIVALLLAVAAAIGMTFLLRHVWSAPAGARASG